MSEEAELGLGTVKKTTERALLIRFEELGEEHWIPRSVIKDGSSDIESNAEKGAEGEVVLQEWFAKQECLV